MAATKKTSDDQESIAEQAVDFGRKKRVEEIKQCFRITSWYTNLFRAHNICNTKAANMFGNSSTYALSVPGMLEMGYGRMLSGG
jgi:hypothetical protein